ncbi:hypothetical protein P20652_0508 [Pseudoalteromonas sp. BSi20652]|nr:hypothetical protein P20652_0508 [Pseudoalteromonas sp. BSi20652]
MSMDVYTAKIKIMIFKLIRSAYKKSQITLGAIWLLYL